MRYGGDTQQNDPIRVLVVEDETMIRLSIAEFLRDEGFSVLEASHASEAQHLLIEPDTVDAVFTDVQMPGAMDGVELASWLRSQHPEVAVLLTSGRIPSSHVQDLPAASAIVVKPYDNDRVARQIEALVKEKRSARTA